MNNTYKKYIIYTMAAGTVSLGESKAEIIKPEVFKASSMQKPAGFIFGANSMDSN